MPFLIGELLDAGLMHPDVQTSRATASAATATSRTSTRRASCAGAPPRARPATTSCCAPSRDAFAPDGGIRVLDGALGRAVMKVSRGRARAPRRHRARARLRRPGRLPRRLRARRARPRPRGRRPPPGPARERHARAAQAHARARRADGPRPSRRARHRRAHVAARRARSRRRSTARPRRRPAGRCRACATATSCGWTRRAGRLEVDVDLGEREPWIPEHATHGTGRELFAAFRDRVGRPDAGASVFDRRADDGLRMTFTVEELVGARARSSPSSSSTTSPTPCRWPRRSCAAACPRSR